MKRAGFTLIEILVALVVGSILSALVFATVLRVNQTSRGRAERAGLQSTLRNAGLPIALELEGAGNDSIGGVDLTALSPQSLTVRGERGFLPVCGLALPDTLVVTTRDAALWTERSPVPGRDSLLLYLPGDSLIAIDAWLPLPLIAGPFSGSCPGGSAGWRLVSSLDSITAGSRRLGGPTVLRFFETIAFRLYGAGLNWQVGREGISAGAFVQPVAGPLVPQGLELEGLTSSLVSTAVLSNIATVRVRVLAPGSRDAAVGPGLASPQVDSLVWLAPLRNTR